MRRNVKRRLFILSVLFVAVLGAAAYIVYRPTPRTTGTMPQQAYVWQRAWTPAVRDAVSRHGSQMQALVVLAAEVSLKDRSPHVTAVDVDYAQLAALGQPVGLALRIGPTAGPLTGAGSPQDAIADIAAGVVARARREGLPPSELQLDFDCPESKLDGYAAWAAAIRRRIAPVPLAVTALPSWLDRRDFAKLLQNLDGYVLQVHSLVLPRSPDRLGTLCDAAQARAAVEQAARLGKPFRVALPTYGYHVAFSPEGKYIGISAEGPSPNWPAGSIVKDLDADAAQIARLVHDWTLSRPSLMQGLIWYRLPVAGDHLNWAWPTLQSVMAGKVPQPRLEAGVKHGEPGLVEIELANAGDADALLNASVRITSGKILSADALAGYQYTQTNDGLVLEPPAPAGRLKPGQTILIGWIRLSDDKEVTAHVQQGERR